MRKFFKLLLPAVLPAFFCLHSCQQAEEGPAEALPEAPVTSSIATLDNGLKLIIKPHGDDPLVSIAFRCAAGSDQETSGEAGFSTLLANSFTTGDTGSFAQRLEGLGTSLSIDFQPDSLILGITVLSEDAVEAAGIIFDLLDRQLEDEEIIQQRDLLLEELRNLRGEAGKARDILNAALFPGSPQSLSLADKIGALEALTPESFRNFINKCIRPESSILAVVGNLSQSISREIEDAAGSWSAPDWRPGLSPFMRREQVSGPAPIKIVPLRVAEASLFFARRLPALDPETYYPLLAVNFILNGQSTYGRLTGLQVRSELTRPLNSTLQLWLGGSGQVVQAAVPAERAGEMVRGLMDELGILHSGTIGGARLLEQEISDAKNSLRGRLLRRTETTAQLAQFILWSEAYGFPGSDVEDHLSLIEGITREKLLELIEEHFRPEFTALIAVGPADILRRQLSDFGEVEVVQP